MAARLIWMLLVFSSITSMIGPARAFADVGWAASDEIDSVDVESEEETAEDAAGSVQFDNSQIAHPSDSNLIGSQSVNTDENDTSGWSFRDRTYLNYYGILYGPSIAQPSSFQSTPAGEQSALPIYIRNYATAGYAIDTLFSASATAYWVHVPVNGQKFYLRDPYLRLAMADIINSGGWNYYVDTRFHLPISDVSKEADLLVGLQNFQVLTFTPSDSRLTLGTYGSARLNLFGSRGTGSDLELYFGPNLSYRLTPTVAATVLYEMSISHAYGDEAFSFINDGNDVQPGISWDITPSINFNPYLTIYTGSETDLKSTSIGMTLSWLLL